MLKLPGRLRVVERGAVARELKLVHQLMGLRSLFLEQKSQENLELDQLRGLILIVARRLGKECFEPIARFRIFPFLEGNLREVVLGFAKFRIGRQPLRRTTSASSNFPWSIRISPRRLSKAASLGVTASARSRNFAAPSKSRCSKARSAFSKFAFASALVAPRAPPR